MATVWYVGTDGIEYSYELEDTQADDYTCEQCGSGGLVVWYEQTHGSPFGAALCAACYEADGQEDKPRHMPLDIDAWRILEDVKRIVAYERIGCADLPLDWDDVLRQVDQLRRDIEELRDHRCQWSGDEYCTVCGADGRA